MLVEEDVFMLSIVVVAWRSVCRIGVVEQEELWLGNENVSIEGKSRI